MKLFSDSCERNQAAILTQLQSILAENTVTSNTLLEVGSGTGQHAAFFSKRLPWMQWQPSDLLENHSSIEAWQKELDGENCLPVIEIDLAREETDVKTFDNIFTANTLHIISWPLVEQFFKLALVALPSSGQCIVYGPFNYNGQYTSDSNARFDLWLKSRDFNSGIRDIEAIEALAKVNHLSLQQDVSMPANNRLLVFKKS